MFHTRGDVIKLMAAAILSTAVANAHGSVSIASPVAGSTASNAVRITATAKEARPFHLRLIDNGWVTYPPAM